MDDSATSDDPAYYGAACYTPEDSGTSHVSIVDEMGMAVAVTSTINLQLVIKIFFILRDGKESKSHLVSVLDSHPHKRVSY